MILVKYLRIVLFIILFVVLRILSVSGNDSADTLVQAGSLSRITVASEPDYPPYCIVDKDGNPDGFSVELFKAAASAVGLEPDIRPGVWNVIRKELEEGRIDALPLVGRTPEREEIYDFTFSYLSLHGAVFVRKNDRRIKSVDDLKNKSVIVMEGDNAEEYIRRIRLTDKIVLTHTFSEAFRLLASNQHDAVITHRVLGETLLKELNISSVVPLDMFLPDFRQDFCFAVKKGNKELLSRLNEGLSIIIANKTYDRIHLKWFGPSLKQKISLKDILTISAYIIIPLVIIFSIIMIVFLRRLVKSRTTQLSIEIAGHKKTEEELINLKNELERKVHEKTKELQERIDDLERFHEATINRELRMKELKDELKELRSRVLQNPDRL